MAKITVKAQKVFGETAGVDQLSQIGSLAAAAPAYSTDPDVIQALSNYSDGMFAVVDGDNSPAIEDHNSLFYITTRQLAYLMQTGVPEWNADTIYFIGSLANDGTGVIYKSIVDNNVNNALSDNTKWLKVTKTLTTEEFNYDATWFCPSNVTKITVRVYTNEYSRNRSDFGTQYGITPEGDGYAWGPGTNGQLGNNGSANVSVPTIINGSHKWRMISGSRLFAMGVDTLGRGWAWGGNTDGNFGNIGTTSTSTPVLISSTIQWRALSACYLGSGGSAKAFGFGIDKDLNAYGWGNNDSYQLGNGTNTSNSSPVIVSGGRQWIFVGGGHGGYGYGLNTGNNIFTWGTPDVVAGNGLSSNVFSTPTILSLDKEWIYVSSSERSMGAIDSLGDLYVWGTNDTGQLGLGDTTQRLTPTILAHPTGKKWKKIAIGFTSILIDDTMAAYAMGGGINGEIGNNGAANKSTPTLVNGSILWEKAFCSNGTSQGVDIHGNTYCWGAGSFGSIGNGGTSAVSVPTLVTTIGGPCWLGMNQQFLAEKSIDVTPGTFYDLYLSTGIVSFSTTPIYQQPGQGQPVLMSIEYLG